MDFEIFDNALLKLHRRVFEGSWYHLNPRHERWDTCEKLRLHMGRLKVIERDELGV
ncbi:MAG: hypothetical protein JJU05_04660 [Verrucomicrobia bacterium]|nr:hypothetical protein [Verrucomicrobiota bacterium]MCH8526861.1 hypothetical protein [Kiritimatiellia bacterium]